MDDNSHSILTCSVCGKDVSDCYYIVNDKKICLSCGAVKTVSNLFSFDIVPFVDNVVAENILLTDIESGDPVYTRSDGTVAAVPNVILASGGAATAAECELQDDIENMSQPDFFSKYADNSPALDAYISTYHDALVI